MKMNLISGLTALTFALILTACGELPPERIAEIERNNGTRVDPSSLIVASLQVNSSGSVDLQYSAFYQADIRVFSFFVTRANRSTVNRTVSLTQTDARDLYSALVQVFTGKLAIHSRACGTASSAIVTGINSAITSHSCPALTLPGSNTNLLDSLGTFILNRL